jgi:hypothetical protein
MDFHGSQVLAIEIGSVLTLAPLIVWLALYVTARWWSIDLRPALQWLRMLRWVAWGSAVVLLVAYMVHGHFPLAYAAAMFTFQLGLALPESWVKRRFAPDLIESPEGYWPGKRE